jgi:hypothetical protein
MTEEERDIAAQRLAASRNKFKKKVETLYTDELGGNDTEDEDDE